MLLIFQLLELADFWHGFYFNRFSFFKQIRTGNSFLYTMVSTLIWNVFLLLLIDRLCIIQTKRQDPNCELIHAVISIRRLGKSIKKDLRKREIGLWQAFFIGCSCDFWSLVDHLKFFLIAFLGSYFLCHFHWFLFLNLLKLWYSLKNDIYQDWILFCSFGTLLEFFNSHICFWWRCISSVIISMAGNIFLFCKCKNVTNKDIAK